MAINFASVQGLLKPKGAPRGTTVNIQTPESRERRELALRKSRADTTISELQATKAQQLFEDNEKLRDLATLGRDKFLEGLEKLDPERAQKFKAADALIEGQFLTNKKSIQDLNSGELKHVLAKQAAAGAVLMPVSLAAPDKRSKVYNSLKGQLGKVIGEENVPENYDEDIVNAFVSRALPISQLMQTNPAIAGEISPVIKQALEEQEAKDLAFLERKAELSGRGKGKGGKGLSGDAAKTLAIGTKGQEALNQMEALFDSGEVKLGALSQITPTFMLSESGQKFRTLRDDLADMIGRLRSGGAINEGEEKRFMRLLPKLGDKIGTIKFKIKRLKEMLKAVVDAMRPEGGGGEAFEVKSKEESAKDVLPEDTKGPLPTANADVIAKGPMFGFSLEAIDAELRRRDK